MSSWTNVPERFREKVIDVLRQQKRRYEEYGSEFYTPDALETLLAITAAMAHLAEGDAVERERNAWIEENRVLADRIQEYEKRFQEKVDERIMEITKRARARR